MVANAEPVTIEEGDVAPFLKTWRCCGRPELGGSFGSLIRPRPLHRPKLVRQFHPTGQFGLPAGPPSQARHMQSQRYLSYSNRHADLIVTLLLGSRIAPVDTRAGGWNEKLELGIFQLCGNKCETPRYSTARSGRSWPFPRRSPSTDVVARATPIFSNERHSQMNGSVREIFAFQATVPQFSGSGKALDSSNIGLLAPTDSMTLANTTDPVSH